MFKQVDILVSEIEIDVE